jgi:glycosyltransferase involved in cell wall biosynthesis
VAKVVLDLRMVRGALHGIARYALELARRLPRLEPSWQFIGLTGPDGLPNDLGLLHPPIPLTKCHAEFLSPFEQPALASSLVVLRPNLFHATSFSVPGLWPGKLVVTLHDATHLALPETSSRVRAAYYKLVVGPRAKSASALITVSEFSRQEISKHLGLSPFRLQVISNGVDPIFAPPSPLQLEDFCARRGLPMRYFAAIGSHKPHKNLRMLTPIADQLPLKLALLAGRGAKRDLGFPSGTLELSPLSDPELVNFYGGATAVLVPSRYEGFGLPALEAMACGAPVIAADAGALPEITGNAAVLVPPDDVNAWKEAVLKLHRDPALRAELSERGKLRAARFTWEDCAQQTLEVYRRALQK